MSAARRPCFHFLLLFLFVFSAPELPLYNDGHYGFPVDIWSSGCVFAEILRLFSGGEGAGPVFPVISSVGDNGGQCRGVCGSTCTAVYLSFGPIGQNFCHYCDTSVREKAWRSCKRVAQAT